MQLDFPVNKYSTIGDRAFGTYGPKKWNALPVELRIQEDFQKFKGELKTHLFKEAFSTIINSR